MQLRSGKVYGPRTVRKYYGPKKRSMVKRSMKPTVSKIARNVRYLNKAVQGETKYRDNVSPSDFIPSVSQCYADSTGVLDAGWSIIDVTPTPSQGTGDHDRVGNQIKIKSFQFRFQGSQQKALSSRMRLKIQLFRVKGSPVDVSTQVSAQAVMARIYESNPSTQFTDFHSIRNTSFFTEFEPLMTKYVSCEPDTIRVDATGALFAQICDAQVHKKISRAVRWDTYNPDVISNGQILMVVLASTGNKGVSNITGVYPALFNPQAQSGLAYNYAIRWNFTDK